MPRKRSGLKHGSLVLDCEGLSKIVEGDKVVLARVKSAREQGVDVVVSGITLLEAQRPQLARAQLEWVTSWMVLIDPTIDIIKEAGELLRARDLHGHQHAIDAVVAATALRQSSPVMMLTSDPDDMRRLCEERVKLVTV